MERRARDKRKLAELEQEDSDDDDDEDQDSTAENDDHSDDNDNSIVMNGIVKEVPGQGIKKVKSRSNKRQKVDDGGDGSDDKSKDIQGDKDANLSAPTDSQKPAAVNKEKKGDTKSKKKKRAAEKVEALVAAAGDSQASAQAESGSGEQEDTPKSIAAKPGIPSPSTSKPSEPITPHIHNDTEPDSHLETTLPLHDPAEAAPAADPTTSTSTKHVKVATADMDALRARLAAKIEALRAARKADGTNGRPVRTRQDLIEARRVKQDQRKARKLELRRQAKIEEEQKREETLVSNSPMSPSLDIDEETAMAGNLSFGRVSFKDGAQLSHDLSRVLGEGKKKKGPSDPKTALIKLQNRKTRLEALDKDVREDAQMNDAWTAAKRQALGEKVVGEATLKKTIKRKEQAKKKSEQQWTDRIKLTNHAIKEKQRKREDNLQKRKDEKTLGKAGKKKVGSKKRNAARPGFEGNFGLGGKKK